MPEQTTIRQHLAVRRYGSDGLILSCRCGNYEPVDGTVREKEDAHRDHRVAMGETVQPRVPTPLERAEARVAELTTELARYVGVEPTVADELAYLQRCLNAVYEVCDQAAAQATRWEHPLPIPEWVLTVRQAADGDRPANPDDKRRRIYVDGKGNGWIDAGQGLDGTQDVMGITDQWQLKTATDVATETGSLHEIGRCW